MLLVFGFLKIKAGMHFPGRWALIPVIGALCLIAAGENACFNRLILKNKVAVFIGRISYPLYLWHWPLLCYAKIYWGEMPSVATRWGILLVAILFAFLTTFLIENPLRFGGKKRLKVRLLCIVMLLLGVAGGIGFVTTAKERNDFGQEWWATWGKWLKTGNRESPKKIILFGDSHMAHFELQLAEKLGNDYAFDRIAGLCWVGKNKMSYSANALRAFQAPANLCENIQRELIAAPTPEVVVTGNSGFYSLNPKNADEFYDLIMQKVALFDPAPKKFIFVGDPGNIDVLCEQANYRSRLIRPPKECKPPYDIAPYLNFSRWSREKKFPDFVHFVYPFEMLCDEKGHCQAFGEHGANFWDDNHLTFWGSEPVAAEIAKIIKEK